MGKKGKSFNNRTCKYLNRLYSVGGQKTNSCPSSQQHSWHLFFSKYSLCICVRWKGSSLTLFPSSFQWLFLCCRAAAGPRAALQWQTWHLAAVCSQGMYSPEPQPRLDSSATHSTALTKLQQCPYSPLKIPGAWGTKAPTAQCRFMSGEHKIHWTITQPFTAPIDFWGATPKALPKRSARAAMCITQKNYKDMPRDIKFI